MTGLALAATLHAVLRRHLLLRTAYEFQDCASTQGFSTMNLMVTPLAPGRSRVTFRLLTTIDNKFIRSVTSLIVLTSASAMCLQQPG